MSLSVVSNSLGPPWTVAPQAPLSLGFSRHGYWSGLPFLPPGNPADPGMEPTSPSRQVESLPPEPRPGVLRTGTHTQTHTDTPPHTGTHTSHPASPGRGGAVRRLPPSQTCRQEQGQKNAHTHGAEPGSPDRLGNPQLSPRGLRTVIPESSTSFWGPRHDPP